jgi:uncharacterized protein YciI
MIQPLLLCAATLICAMAVFNQSQPPASSATQPATRPTAGPPAQFDRYHCVVLLRGDNPPALDAVQSQQLQSEHLGHLKKMSDEGHMLVAGPFANQWDDSMRGMCLYNASLSRQQVREFAESDPAVRAGRLKVEIMDWYTAKGALAFPLQKKAEE